MVRSLFLFFIYLGCILQQYLTSFFKHKNKKSDQKSIHFEILTETVKKISVYDSINYLNMNTIVWNEKLKTSDLLNQNTNDSVFLIKIISNSLKIFDDQ